MMATFGRTWWGQRFLEALAQFTDPGRLGRGRAYANNGRIVEHTLTNGTVHAKVRGSINEYFGVYEEPIYKTTIKITQISPAQWMKVIERIAARADLVTRLLQQEMPDQIEDVFDEEGVHLLPHSQSDFVTTCSCPDWDNPCKHIAGVYYLLAKDLDGDPFVLFELRGLSREALHTELVKSPLGTILASALEPDVVPLEPVDSFHTRPTKLSAANAAHTPASSTASNGTKATGGKKLSSRKKAVSGSPEATNGDAPADSGAAHDSTVPPDAKRPDVPSISHREFWAGARRLVPSTATAPSASSSQARVSALLVKKQGDFPPFWHRANSFIEVMEELYDRVRNKSPQMK
jgi:uncharacterized Zn finger protein